MKKSLSLCFLACLLLTAVAAPVSFAEKSTTPSTAKNPKVAAPAAVTKPAKFQLSIVELTNAENYRYGREMFLSGNYPEAVKAFEEILRLDCHNKVAQYHLLKIAVQNPDFAYLKDELKNLPCGTYDFTKEDFLPASLYYEKDTDILLEQIISYQKRQRMNEEELKAKAEKYSGMVTDLETRTAGLMQTTPDKEPAEKTTARIADERRAAYKLDKQIAYLKSELALERLERQKKLQDMRTRLAAAESRLSENEDAPAAPAAPPSYSPKAVSLMEAIAQARTQLEGKEKTAADKDKELAALQERFDDIQRRLKIIQDELVRKTAQMQSLETNLQDMQDHANP